MDERKTVGETDLKKLLASLKPKLHPETYVFCTAESCPSTLQPLLLFKEPEGLTLVTTKSNAINHGLGFVFESRLITLEVHSSLEAVGLMAAITSRLAQHGIPANAVSAYFHDHLFVPSGKAEQALKLLDDPF